MFDSCTRTATDMAQSSNKVINFGAGPAKMPKEVRSVKLQTRLSVAEKARFTDACAFTLYRFWNKYETNFWTVGAL